MQIICGREIKGFGCVIAYEFLVFLLGSYLGRGTRLRMVKLSFRALCLVELYLLITFFFQYLKAFLNILYYDVDNCVGMDC